MAEANFVKVILRPGVQSIDVYKWYQAPIQEQSHWVPYQSSQRIPAGTSVKFAIVPYADFILTSWEAYYADEYDDTIQIALSSVTGESAWTFTMPSAEVFIRCEAESTGQEVNWIFPTLASVADGPYVKVTETFLDFDSFFAAYISLLSGDNYSITGLASDVLNTFRQRYDPTKICYLDRYDYSDDTMKTAVVFGVSDEDVGAVSDWIVDLTTYRFDYNGVGMVIDGNSIPFDSLVQTFTAASLSIGKYVSATRNRRILFNATKAIIYQDTPGSQEASIRYIFNPDSSGEVDSSAPTEFVQGTTEFTFTWRIKTGYSLRRMTPFAVGEGSIEDDVLESSVYDGETRTYTVTVQQIPFWAKGVRVHIECINHNDPNVGGNSDTGGGDGTFDDSSDPVPIEPMPSISAADAGLITLFRPSLSEIKGLGAYLWTNITDFIENLQKMFASPMDTIIALNILPGLPPVGTPRNIRLGLWETNIAMPPVLSQWYEIDFGSVNIREYWGSALDYSPNTKIHAMLPFIGSVQLSTDDVMGTTVGLVYRIDLLSGHLVAMITVNDDVLYQFTGECAVAVPLTGADWSRVYGAIAGTIAAVAVGVAGASAAGTATAGLSQTATAAEYVAAQADFDYMSAAISGAGQSQLSALESSARQLNAAAMRAIGRRNAAEAAKVAGAFALGGNTVNQIMGAKFQVAHSGTISGSAGLLGIRRPYIYIEYPNQSLPENYKHFYGYPANMHANLGSLSGFTQCYQVLLTGVNGTDSEIAEILELLKEGVYL